VNASPLQWIWLPERILDLITDAQPAASEKASLLHTEPVTLFHGAISADTPTGSMTTVAAPIFFVKV